MRRSLATVIGTAALVLAGTVTAQVAPPQTANPMKIAVIDVQQVVEQSAAGKEALARLKKLNDEKVAEGRKMAADLEALQKQLSTQGPTLTQDKVADLQKQIEDKKVALNRFRDDAQQALDDARKKELDGLEKQIMPIINDIGREGKYLMIFNKFQSGLVYADDQVDITEEVLRRFNTKVTQ
jgi:outer membrane protein